MASSQNPIKYKFANKEDADTAIKVLMDQTGNQEIQHWSIEKLKSILTIAHKASDAYRQFGGVSGGHPGNVGVNGGVPQTFAAIWQQLFKKEKAAGQPLSDPNDY